MENSQTFRIPQNNIKYHKFLQEEQFSNSFEYYFLAKNLFLHQGENARYSVRLESAYPPGAADAFLIQPAVGYQRQTFFMTTANHSALDFEDEDYRYGIELRVRLNE